jgi:hypothetical protein
MTRPPVLVMVECRRCDQVSVPPEQRVGCEDPAVTAGAWQRFGDHSEQGPVAFGDDRFRGAAQDGELVAQHDHLQIFRAT